MLDRLLVKLMISAIENFGAQRGCLLLDRDCQLEIVATIESQTISLLPAIILDSEVGRGLVSLAVVNYVADTQENIVIEQTNQEGLFDRDTYILDRQPQSILCVPLINKGQRVGILYLENFPTAPLTTQRLEILQFLFTQVAISLDNTQIHHQLEFDADESHNQLTQANDRLQTEILKRQKSEQILRSIVAGTVSATGVDFFRSLVRSLAQALGVRYAFISECMDAPPTRGRSFAFWQGDKFGEEFEYNFHGTPCERIIDSKSYQCFPAQIQALFPEEKDELEAMEAQSYAGVPLLTSTGDLLGHLAVLDDRPMASDDAAHQKLRERDRSILEIFAARAAAEMERLQVEDELRVSETKFATAFRASPDAIAISNLNDGTYIEINDRCLQMLGYSRAETIGRSDLDLAIWAHLAERMTIATQLQDRGTVSNLEVWLRRKSGEIFPALLSAEAIDLEGESCLLAVASDITLLKQAETAVLRLAEIGELAATIVHEVRNPLTTIMMGLTAFKKLELDDRFQEYLALSIDEADRLQRLLNQILLYAKPQTLDRSELELNSFISEILNTLQTAPVAIGKPLNFVAMRSPVNISVDRDKFKQVLINLVTNACEAVSVGDPITIQIRESESRRICIQIHNGGMPIPTDLLPQLTKPFFTTKASGTGLGLAIVKRIVEAHDGELQIESREGIGSIVTVQLPLFLS
ncbi:GAF domain-containing sensor histidine kinase [Chamaesiphon minutus]|uniref:histidine kinase n=1 Tax=Chamaesiphon minutus (strain ATCC 27169 / PCC 6605) TaxID=1173020 RepID=K9URF9_CHAP6|nr:GAF domain-containing sensor histidine kinase [Chamaesiphon minutus]AFY97051.1 histidine kinase,histidine kinase,GAF domain-containing protein,PAS domain-containing protein [Chamaesiphon minutus PCC 6605]